MNIELLISDLEQFFSMQTLMAANLHFTATHESGDETVTASEWLANLLSSQPNAELMLSLVAEYQRLHAGLPDCRGKPGLVSWTCCDVHRRMAYAHFLLRAIAISLRMESESQPLSEQWLCDLRATV